VGAGPRAAGMEGELGLRLPGHAASLGLVVRRSGRNVSTCLRQWVREFSEASCRDVGSERNSLWVTGNRLIASKVLITPRW
jgi:hypothetical protein